MLTKGQVFVLNPGQTLDISCEFQIDDLNMFVTPFVWKKYQRQEETTVNILGNIMPPFLATGRFESTLEQSPPSPRYCLRLRIKSKLPLLLYNLLLILTKPSNTLRYDFGRIIYGHIGQVPLLSSRIISGTLVCWQVNDWSYDDVAPFT